MYVSCMMLRTKRWNAKPQRRELCRGRHSRLPRDVLHPKKKKKNLVPNVRDPSEHVCAVDAPSVGRRCSMTLGWRHFLAGCSLLVFFFHQKPGTDRGRERERTNADDGFRVALRCGGVAERVMHFHFWIIPHCSSAKSDQEENGCREV